MKFCPECGKQQEPGGRFCAECGFALGGGTAASTPAASTPAASTPDAPAAPAASAPASGPTTPGAPAAENRQLAAVGAAGQSASGQPAPGQSASGQAQGSIQPHQQRQEQPYPGTPGTGQAQAPIQSAVKRPSAFAGVPVSDYVRDGLAVLALVVSLFLVWTSNLDSYYADGSKAGTRVDVLLITLLSILSVGVSYLWRAGVFGPTVGYRKIQDIRLLANLPYFVLVLVYFVLSMVSGSGSSDDRYLGHAVAFGLAGAVLAAQPRRGEIAPGDVDQSRHRRWLIAVLGIVGLAAVTALVQIIRFAIVVSSFSGSSNIWPMVATGSFGALLSVAVLAVVGLMVFRGSDAWRVAGVALGVGGALLAVLAIMGVESIDLDYFPGSPWFSVQFWMAFGAAVSAPSVARVTQRTAAAPADRRTALRPVLTLTLILASALAVLTLFGLVQTLVEDYDGVATWAVALVLALLLAAGAVVTPKLAARDERSPFVMGSVYAIALFAVSLVLMILFAVQDFEPSQANASPLPLGIVQSLIMVLTWIMPFALLAVLWLDKSAREHFKSLPTSGTSGTGFAFEGAPAQGRAAQEGAVTPGIPTPQDLQPGQQHHFPQQAPVDAKQEPQVQPRQETPVQPQQVPAHEPAQAAPARNTPEQAGPRVPAADPDAALIAEAADPATPLIRLQQLATHPRARVAVAANPSTYPDLLGWLSQLGDPAVNEALYRRRY